MLTCKDCVSYCKTNSKDQFGEHGFCEMIECKVYADEVICARFAEKEGEKENAQI